MSEGFDFALVVTDVGSCNVLRPADRWFFKGHQISAQPGSRICVQALCHIYPQALALMQAIRAGRRPSSTSLVCSADDCLATFRLERIATALEPRESSPTAVTRRMEKHAMEHEARLEDQWPFMKRVPLAVAAQLVSACNKESFAAGRVILPEGVQGEKLFIVEDGKVEVMRPSPVDGSEMVLAVLGAGECFGEMSLLTGQATSACVRARTDALILTLTRPVFEELLSESPALHRVFSKLLADRLRALNTSLEKELSRGILGKLTMISAVDLVQTLNASRRTGTLVVSRSGLEARIYFQDGKVHSALLGDTKGEDAFYEVLAWRDGDFCFENTAPPADEAAQVERDTMGLLMEAMRRMDEGQKAAGDATPL